MPQNIRPFESFLRQGMQNTNQNINTMNRPDSNQNIMSQQGRGFYESPGGGEGEPGGSTGPGGSWAPGFGMEGINPIGQEGEGFITEQFDSSSYYDMFNQLPPQLQEQIVEQGGFYSLDDPNSIMGGLMNDYWSGTGWDMSGAQDWINDYTSGYQDTPTLPSGEIGGGVEGEVIEGYSAPQAPTNFAGGGGLAGSLAKKLYYPSTSGGFAGTGSGIGGGNSLEDFLKKLNL